MKDKVVLCFMAIFLLVMVSACTSYERQVVPFKLPAAYPNAVEAADAFIAAKAYDDKDGAAAAFGFDIKGAGILPIQVIFDNKGGIPWRLCRIKPSWWTKNITSGKSSMKASLMIE